MSQSKQRPFFRKSKPNTLQLDQILLKSVKTGKTGFTTLLFYVILSKTRYK